MKRNTPQITVVIPAYNAERFILEAVESALCQESNFHFEVVVVDDGSTDKTAALVAKYAAKDSRLQLIKSLNGGPGSARNLGVEAAQGEIVLFLDADDKMLPGRVAHQGAFMLRHPDVSVTFGDMIVQNDPASPLDKWDIAIAKAVDFTEIHHPFNRLVADGCYVCNSATAIRKSDYLSIGMQRTDLRVAEDFDLWCRLAAAGKRFFLTKKQYTWLRRENHGNLMTSHHAYRGPAIVLAEQLKLNGKLLSGQERQRAQDQLDWRANMYLRYLWAFERHNLDDVLSELEDVVSPKIIIRWKKAKIIPSCAGRWLRKTRHLLKI